MHVSPSWIRGLVEPVAKACWQHCLDGHGCRMLAKVPWLGAARCNSVG
jgi:hypothetical protein